jgi:cell fate (sporulation/competence/biofilm development) regulator YlbF (YheA/YmcA/DUF963 family)
MFFQKRSFNKMDIIQSTRELGAALQKDERYIKFRDQKAAMDADEALQEKIGAFNLARINLNNAMSGDSPDREEIQVLNEKIRSLYAELMGDDQMINYEAAKSELDVLISQINTIIDVSISGGDPLVCDLTACTHDCSTCGGCG